MTIRPATTRGRRSGRPLAAALAALAVAWPLAASIGTASPAAAAPGDHSVGSVRLTTVEPPIETGRQPVHVAGSVQLAAGSTDLSTPSPGSSTGSSTSGSGAVTDLTVTLGIGSVIRTQGALTAIRTDPNQLAEVTHSLTSVSIPGPVAPGATMSFDLPKVAADQVRLPGGIRPGGALSVYPLSVAVTGTVDGQAGQAIARASSFLVWSPPKVPERTGIGVVLPIADQPRIGPDGTSLLDDDLATEIKPGGRLSMLVKAAQPPVALAVDPETARAVNLMTTPYRVGTGAHLITHRADPNAKALLDGLRTFAADGGQILALPYGDPDIVALTRAKQLHQVRAPIVLGRAILREVLGRVPITQSVAYPPGGAVDEATLGLLHGNQITTVVLNDQALPPSPALTYTPSAGARAGSGSTTTGALVADGDLAAVATAGDRLPGAQLASARANYFAETALLTAERPQQARPQLIALPRLWNPTSAWLKVVLGQLTTPWSAAVPLAKIPIPSAAEAAAAPAERGALTYPAQARAAEIPAAAIAATADVRTRVLALQSVLCPPATPTPTSTTTASPIPSATPSAGSTKGSAPAANTVTCSADGLVNGMLDALVAVESTFWRGDPGGADSLRNQVTATTATIGNHIRLVASRSVTLTSRKGRVPVTLENDLDQTVSVRLELSAPDIARIASPRVIPSTLGPRGKAQISIRVQAENAGSFPIKIALLTPAGQPLSSRPPTQVLVRSTVYGVIATVITVCALGVLALAVVVRSVRRVRAARRARRDPSARRPNGPADGPAMAAGSAGQTTGGTA